MIQYKAYLTGAQPPLRQMNMLDLYTPSEQGDRVRVQKVMDHMVAEVRELTRSAGAELDLDRADVDGRTALMLAASNGHVEVCEFLVSRGAHVSVTCTGKPGIRNWGTAVWRSWTALHLAARYNSARVVQVLAKNGALLEESQWLDLKGQTPLHIAARWNAREAAVVLVKHWPQWLGRLELSRHGLNGLRAFDSQGKRPEDLAVGPLKRILRPGDSFFTALEAISPCFPKAFRLVGAVSIPLYRPLDSRLGAACLLSAASELAPHGVCERRVALGALAHQPHASPSSCPGHLLLCGRQLWGSAWEVARRLLEEYVKAYMRYTTDARQ